MGERSSLFDARPNLDQYVKTAQRAGGGYATVEVFAGDLEALCCAVQAQLNVDALTGAMSADFDRISGAFELKRRAFGPFLGDDDRGPCDAYGRR